MTYKKTFLFFLILISGLVARSQTASGIQTIIASADTLRSRMPAEKLYIQFDKPYYSTGDTIWMKAYLMDAAFLTASKSGVVYLELVNDTNKVLMRRMLPVITGLGSGNLVLDKDDVPEGSYTIRAYTNLMRNFGEERIFKKSFYVSSRSAQSWLVNSKVSLSTQAGKDNLHLDLQFNKLNKESLGFHDLEFRVRNGRRVLLRDKVQTDVEGKIDVNFNLPEKTDPANISLIVADPVKGGVDNKITIPLPINRPENTDLQFMPEGGNLVAGISSVVGFKAISEDGKGLNVSGKVYSNINNQEVAVFNSSHKGMGAFELNPKEGETYTAKITLTDGSTKNFVLPPTKSTGPALRITNSADNDSIDVTMSIPATVKSAAYYLTAQSRGVICYGAVIRFNGNNSVMKKVAKSVFPTGIARFTLMNSDVQPLNERITFINHYDALNINVASTGSYKTRDSITLAVEVRDHEGNPVQGSFSIAVTDDNQVRVDSLGNNVTTSFFLTSDLKGIVEDPMYYFTAGANKDLDLLLLTQGWVGYNWTDVFSPPVPQFAAEPEFVVHGNVTNAFNKPVSSTQIQLVSTKPGLAVSNLTANDGSFTFSSFPVADSLTLFLQTKNKRNKSFNVGITVDGFKPPAFKTVSERIMPWYVNSDTSLIKYIKAGLEKKQEEFKLKGNVLNEVTITAKKIIKYSKNLNGPGESDQTIEEKEVLKAGKVTLNDLLLSKILGFRNKEGIYVIQGLITHLIVDGIDVEFDGGFKKLIPPAEDLREYFLNIDAEDIKGIEVMTTPRYQYRYKNEYLHDPKIDPMNPLMDPTKHAWIEVTTRGGQGIFQKKSAGIYVYRPIPFTGSKQFYSPKYAVKTPVVLSDLRSTIFWEPDVVTDKEGKALISFYAADRPGTYSVVTEGSDMTGNVGSKKDKIVISP